jgi:hypothetical protein
MFGWSNHGGRRPPALTKQRLIEFSACLHAQSRKIIRTGSLPDDAALFTQPYLASLNISLGDTSSKRFKAVRFDDVVECAAELDGTSLLTNS